MPKRLIKKKKRTSTPGRVVPKSFCYPAPPIDLLKDQVRWLCTTPTPANGAQLSADEVLQQLVLSRVKDDCMQQGDLRKLDKAKASALTELFLEPRPVVANPMKHQPECQAACRRVIQARENKERILIYGDYDCDGVTSVTLLYDALRALGFRAAQIDCVIPDRLMDGYGLQWSVAENPVKRLKGTEWRPNLLVAVDCGTTADKEVQRLIKEQGIDVIILDHHTPDPQHALPADSKVFHLNPKLWLNRPDWEPEHHLEKMCASGLVYQFARYLLSEGSGSRKWIGPRALLLAGLATCVDVMELVGVNRALLKRSLRLANRPGRLDLVPGLAQLKKLVGPYPKTGLLVTEETFGFYWGPCINASGRMAHAYDSLKLLMTRHQARAGVLAAACLKWNRWRKATELAMVEEAKAKAEEQLSREAPPILTASKATWHPGVVGIVAARLREKYGRPAIVGSLIPDEKESGGVKWTGSGRSVKDGCDMGKLLHDAVRNRAITRGGGHPMAGGLSFSDEQRRNLAKSLGNISGFDPARHQPIIEVAAPASCLHPQEWASVFRRLGPFGNGNPCPALIVEAAELIGVRVRTRPVQTAQQRIDEVEAFREEEPPDQDGEGGAAGRTETKRNYWAFSPSEILGLVPLLVRLCECSDPVSQYIRKQLSGSTVTGLEAWRTSGMCMTGRTSGETDDSAEPDRYEGPSPEATDADGQDRVAIEAEKLRAPLVRDLNRILTGQLFNEDRFRDIILRPHTQTIRKQNPTRERLIQLNRLLLEDAFPLELARLTVQGVPRVFCYEGTFIDLVTGKVITAQWVELEEAEMLWEVHRFIQTARDGEETPKLPHVFRLQLELRAFLPAAKRSAIYQGKAFRWDYCFQIRQCIPLERKPVNRLRMPTAKSSLFETPLSKPNPSRTSGHATKK